MAQIDDNAWLMILQNRVNEHDFLPNLNQEQINIIYPYLRDAFNNDYSEAGLNNYYNQFINEEQNFLLDFEDFQDLFNSLYSEVIPRIPLVRARNQQNNERRRNYLIRRYILHAIDNIQNIQGQGFEINGTIRHIHSSLKRFLQNENLMELSYDDFRDFVINNDPPPEIPLQPVDWQQFLINDNDLQILPEKKYLYKYLKYKKKYLLLKK